ncbi:hypothetical protein BS78_K242600 [Paspalum vaginatum]|uniref:Uncharacterized protein n=1 Tax=Paspalum vaginatum TaxID=158149 RepID=A0A9W7X5J0_9POAL|nr:hypothetical protein BS78_K242600 [Paspalum vaginatum]
MQGHPNRGRGRDPLPLHTRTDSPHTHARAAAVPPPQPRAATAAAGRLPASIPVAAGCLPSRPRSGAAAPTPRLGHRPPAGVPDPVVPPSPRSRHPPGPRPGSVPPAASPAPDPAPRRLPSPNWSRSFNPSPPPPSLLQE